MIELDQANIGARVIQVLRNKFVELCLSKAGSHVVEKCLGCGEDEAAGIIFEIMENKENWIQVFTNQYGNYVAQKALSVAKVKRIYLFHHVKTCDIYFCRLIKYILRCCREKHITY